ncbi:MAG: PAS domain-containing protein [Alphaproteobacteria bacterium]|nr:PAS domain-containing protein [Alphaproteobacteria bacterium]
MFALRKSQDAAGRLNAGATTTVGAEAHGPYDPSSQGERRLARRLLRHWQELPRTARLPLVSAVDPSAIGEDWDNCFLIDCRKGVDFPNFCYLGGKLARFSGVFLQGEGRWTTTVLDRATADIRRAVETEEVVTSEDELKLFDGRRLLFRAVLLPMSEDGLRLTHLLGGASGLLLGAARG